MSATRAAWTDRLVGAALPVGLLLIAEFYARATGLQSYSIAAPSAIAEAGARAALDGSLWLATRQTLLACAGGLLIGTAIGLSAGVLLGLVGALNRLASLSVEALRPIPSIALVPIAIMTLGLGYPTEISIIAFATIWPNLILARSAVSGIEPRLLEVARALNLGFGAKVRKIVLPAALPRIFVALRISIGFAFIVALTVEIAAIPLGLGYAMMAAQQALNPALMLAFVVWTGVLGWALNAATLALQKRLFGQFDMVQEAA